MTQEPEQTPTSAESAAVSVRASRRGFRVHVPAIVITALVGAFVGVGANKVSQTPEAIAAPPDPALARGMRDLNERLDRIEAEQRGLRTDVGEIRGDVRGLRSEVRGMRKAAP